MRLAVDMLFDAIIGTLNFLLAAAPYAALIFVLLRIFGVFHEAYTSPVRLLISRLGQ